MLCAGQWRSPGCCGSGGMVVASNTSLPRLPAYARAVAQRAIAYIDGFNFYHGAVREEPELKWLNFEVLCDSLLRGFRVESINYYTASSATPHKIQARVNGRMTIFERFKRRRVPLTTIRRGRA